jgi:hypothetical protein
MNVQIYGESSLTLAGVALTEECKADRAINYKSLKFESKCSVSQESGIYIRGEEVERKQDDIKSPSPERHRSV